MNLSDNHRQINRELEVSLKGMLYIIYLYIRYRVEDNLCRSHACRYLEDNRIWILLYHQLTKSFTILQGILRKNPRSCMICIWSSIFCIFFLFDLQKSHHSRHIMFLSSFSHSYTKGIVLSRRMLHMDIHISNNCLFPKRSRADRCIPHNTGLAEVKEGIRPCNL